MIKLTELLSEKYLYPKGAPLQKGFTQMTKDIDKMMKYAKTWDKFYGDFKRKYSEYPDDTESVGELEALYNDYHSLNERKYYVTYNKGRGRGKDLEMDTKTRKPMTFNSYKDAKEYAEKMEDLFRHSIGGGTAYWVSDEKMNRLER